MTQFFIIVSLVLLCTNILFADSSANDLDLTSFQTPGTGNHEQLTPEQLKMFAKILLKNKKVNGKSLDELNDEELVQVLGSEILKVQKSAEKRNQALEQILNGK